jgi:uncharacterized membrane protein
MTKGRVEAFSDGVIAILITIMVLELKVPAGSTLADLQPVAPIFLTYVLSFVFLGIYWNNHHHLFQAVERVDGAMLWANLHLLFWLSLVPFVTGWMGQNHFDGPPTAVYGIVLFLAGVAYLILQKTIIAAGGRNARIARAVGRDIKGKMSAALYALAIPLAFVNHWIAQAIYFTVAMVWLFPDRRIETTLGE